MRFVKTIGFGAILLAVSACATGLFSNEGAKPFPPLDPAKGRVFVYRTGTFGSAYSPEVMLNGERVIKLDRSGVFFRDVLPGSYAVTTTMTAKVVNFAVAAGEKKYVRFTSSFFESRMVPELVDAAKGEAETAGLSRLGPGQK